MKRCSRCILPEDFPNIEFDAQGVCNYCRKWDVKWKNFDYKKSEMKLVEILERAKSKKRKYDCLVPFSGGRDSSYVLYLIKEKYKLKPLAVTFNNTFISDYAYKNITNLVKRLNVDHVFLSYKPDKLKQYYRSMIKDGGEFCSICTAGINYVITVYQRLYKIPLVIMGTSTRVDEQSPFEITSTHPSYIKKVLKKNDFSAEEVNDFLIKRQYELSAIEKIKLKIQDSDYISINLPDHVEWDNDKIQEALADELAWVTPDAKADHIDCKFANIKYFLKNKQIPNFIFKQQKFSQLIRDGQLRREDALSMLNGYLATEKENPSNLLEFLHFFDLEEVDVMNQEKVSHLDYITKEDLIIKEDLFFKLMSIPWKIYKGAKNIFRH